MPMAATAMGLRLAMTANSPANRAACRLNLRSKSIGGYGDYTFFPAFNLGARESRGRSMGLLDQAGPSESDSERPSQ